MKRMSEYEVAATESNHYTQVLYRVCSGSDVLLKQESVDKQGNSHLIALNREQMIQLRDKLTELLEDNNG